MRSKNKGLSLIEVIFSMWIIAVVIFSTVVCTSGMNAKFNQRKLQALNIAKSELENIKYLVSMGSFALNSSTSTRNYTNIYYITDDQTADLKEEIFNTSSGTVSGEEIMLSSGEPFVRDDNIARIIFDSLPPASQQEPPSLPVLTFEPGYLIKTVQTSSVNLRQQLRDDLSLSGELLANGEPNGKKAFIMDVNAKEYKTVYSGLKPMYIYEIRLRMGWMEKSSGRDILSTQTFYSKMSSAVMPYTK